MMHLVLDAIWARTEVFWWPFFGFGFGPEQLPEVERGLAAGLVLDAIGAACLVWAWQRFGLGDPARRDRFLRTGQLSRELTR
jgi:hypothetical protein